MRSILPLACLALLLTLLTGCGGDSNEVVIHTNQGDIVVRLFNETPAHRDNFKKLVKDGYYDGTLFHRVVPNFMIQGGDPQSIGAAPGVALGNGGPDYTLDHEIGSPHIRGALAAARTNNPEKASSGSQFYIVTGDAQTDATIDQIEKIKGITYSAEQRQAYLTEGGTPNLDMEYTVFGEVLEGMDVVDKISAMPRGTANRPTTDVVMESVEMAR